MESCINMIAIGILVILMTPSILQGLGSYGTEWVDDKCCSALDYKPYCCNRTSDRTSCKGPFELYELDYTAYRFHMAAFLILLTPILCILTEIFCTNDDGDGFHGCCAIIGGFCFLFYPIAGLLSFIGCMIIAGKYSGHSFGSSFNQCLGSGLLVLSITGILIFWAYMKNKRKQRAAAATSANYVENSSIQTVEAPGAAAPYGGPQFQRTETTVEQSAVEHHGFYHFITKVNVIHTVLH